MLGDQLADCGQEFTRHAHQHLTGSVKGGLFLGNGLCLRMRLVVGQDAARRRRQDRGSRSGPRCDDRPLSAVGEGRPHHGATLRRGSDEGVRGGVRGRERAPAGTRSRHAGLRGRGVRGGGRGVGLRSGGDSKREGLRALAGDGRRPDHGAGTGRRQRLDRSARARSGRARSTALA